MLSVHLNATRFAQKPIAQPSYSFLHVPSAERDLTGSSLQFVDDRESFQACMAEMLLVCKEALRRRPSSKGTGTKPLSLEYIADRLDVDDPLFGYIVRTEDNVKKLSNWKRGMLQGFITVTSFTNYHKNFRWDSLNEAAFVLDDDDLTIERSKGERKWDIDGRLAFEMQSTVHCGDIWNEGIVWPRIAEIGLLGGLGCGRTLVSFVIEQLECMKGNEKFNYDYVVLQATDNSISFYESLGFVRVGAIMQDNIIPDDTDAPIDEHADALARTNEIVSSECTLYTTIKPGETPKDIAKKFGVDVWDIIFLNKNVYDEISFSSRLLAGTALNIPVQPKSFIHEGQTIQTPQWYVAREDDTPRFIAKKFNINCGDLVNANKARLPGLLSGSRLKAGTRLKVSHLDVVEYDFKPYAHWSFPDDKFEEGEPSYMMARKLNRRRGNAAKNRPIQAALGVTVAAFEPPTLLLSPSETATSYKKSSTVTNTSSFTCRSKRCYSNLPKLPKRPLCAYRHFMTEQRGSCRNETNGMSVGQSSKFFKSLWDNLSDSEKSKYEKMASDSRLEYERRDKAVFEENLLVSDDCLTASKVSELAATTHRLQQSLYNKVVRLRPGGMTEGSEYRYWYVLTFIPDLKWCHLAPMIQVGVFGSDKPKAKGRPKWKLVDEALGQEIDISSNFCIPIKSKSMKKTLDADKEEWDLIDDGSDFIDVENDSIATSHSNASNAKNHSIAETCHVDRVVASKKGTGPRIANEPFLPLLARFPGNKNDVNIKLIGSVILTTSSCYEKSLSIPKKRGLQKEEKKKTFCASTSLMNLQQKEISEDNSDQQINQHFDSDVYCDTTSSGRSKNKSKLALKTVDKSFCLSSAKISKKVFSRKMEETSIEIVSQDDTLRLSREPKQTVGPVGTPQATGKQIQSPALTLSVEIIKKSAEVNCSKHSFIKETEMIKMPNKQETENTNDDKIVKAEPSTNAKYAPRITRSSILRQSSMHSFLIDSSMTEGPLPSDRSNEKNLNCTYTSDFSNRRKRNAIFKSGLIDPPRKKRKVVHVGSRRSVLQS